jgi:hypothetical protein
LLIDLTAGIRPPIDFRWHDQAPRATTAPDGARLSNQLHRRSRGNKIHATGRHGN